MDSSLKNEMLCPLCSPGIATLKVGTFQLIHQGMPIVIQSYYYKCNTCLEEFTTTESDEASLRELNKNTQKLD